jgi:pimeloyl-ACP methyl ester carboxylesterase
MQRFLRRFLIVAVLGYAALCCAAAIFLAEITLHPGRRPLASADEAQASEMSNRHNAQIENGTILANRGASLQAWLIRPHRGNGDAVILLHGVSDNRIGMIGYAELLVKHGFTVLLPDARAHGSSGGLMATYGLLESEDIRRWYEWLDSHQHPACIFGFGESMGAAQLLSALRAEPNFCAVAAESPFSTFREIAYDRVGQYFHTGPWLGRTLLFPVVEAAFAYARWHNHVDLADVSPLRAASSSHVPIFLIHGQQDSNIPVRHSRAIVARNPSIVLWEVPGADHCGAITVAPEEFENKLIAWFRSHTRVKTSNLVPNSRFPSIMPSQLRIFHV